MAKIIIVFRYPSTKSGEDAKLRSKKSGQNNGHEFEAMHKPPRVRQILIRKINHITKSTLQNMPDVPSILLNCLINLIKNSNLNSIFPPIPA